MNSPLSSVPPTNSTETASCGPDMSVSLGRLRLRNPVLTASGTFGYGSEALDMAEIHRLGGIVGKSVTPEPRIGNPPPRLLETGAGLLNSVGLQNNGIDDFAERILPEMKKLNTAVIASIAGKKPGDYFHCCTRLGNSGIHALELNLSCPNVEKNGTSFAQHPAEVYSITTKVITLLPETPVIVKLTPNTDRIEDAACAAGEAGADAVCVANTYLGMAIDIRTRQPIFANTVAGYSGPAVKPLTLRLVWNITSTTPVPVIASGGIRTAEDAVEFILAGASAVQVGTANLIDPSIAANMPGKIAAYVRSAGYPRLTDVIGTAKENSR